MTAPAPAAIDLGGDTIYQKLAATWQRYHAHDTTPEGIMSLATIIKDAENDAHAIEGAVKNFIDGHLPKLGEVAQAVENSPLVQLALDVAGTLDPAAEQMVLKVLKALADEAPAPAPQAGPAPEPAPVPAG